LFVSTLPLVLNYLQQALRGIKTVCSRSTSTIHSLRQPSILPQPRVCINRSLIHLQKLSVNPKTLNNLQFPFLQLQQPPSYNLPSCPARQYTPKVQFSKLLFFCVFVFFFGSNRNFMKTNIFSQSFGRNVHPRLMAQKTLFTLPLPLPMFTSPTSSWIFSPPRLSFLESQQPRA
jgi:hypothetical protein